MREDDVARNARLLTELSVNPELRQEYREDADGVRRRYGLEPVEFQERLVSVLLTLPERKSQSGMAGVAFAAVAEGIGLAQLLEHSRVDLDEQTQEVVQRASANVRGMTLQGGRSGVSSGELERARKTLAIPIAHPDDLPRDVGGGTPQADDGVTDRKGASDDQSPSVRKRDGGGGEDPEPLTNGSAGGGAGETRFDNQIGAAARKYRLDPALLKALIKQESGFNPSAQSPAGARGLTQLMPSTAKELGVSDPTDPVQAIDGGARYLSQMIRLFGGDVQKGLAAYNAGPGNVKKFGGVPPFEETQNYVRKVTESAATFRDGKGSVAASDDALTSEPEREEFRAPGQIVYGDDQRDDADAVALSSALDGSASSTGELGQRALDAAADQIGVQEVGGEDLGPQVERFQEATGAKGQAWCASFVAWAFERGGHKMPQGNWAAVANWVNAARQGTSGLEIIESGDARPGDIVAYDWGFGDDFGSDGHIGLVASRVHDGNFEAVEGNTSDSVDRVTRNLEQANIVFMRLRS